jgi:hypothetical protein
MSGKTNREAQAFCAGKLITGANLIATLSIEKVRVTEDVDAHDSVIANGEHNVIGLLVAEIVSAKRAIDAF